MNIINELPIKKKEYFMIDVHILLLWVKSWWVSLSLSVSTMISAWFGVSSYIFLWIDPNLATDVAKGLGAITTVAIGFITLFYTIMERNKKAKLLDLELQAAAAKMETDKDKHEELHLIDIIKKLEDANLIDSKLSIEDKIKLAQKYILINE